jgi:hypothetical protein
MRINPVEYCDRHIARLRAEIARREAVGQNPEQYRQRLKTFEALRAVHEGEQRRFRSNAA